MSDFLLVAFVDVFANKLPISRLLTLPLFLSRKNPPPNFTFAHLFQKIGINHSVTINFFNEKRAKTPCASHISAILAF